MSTYSKEDFLESMDEMPVDFVIEFVGRNFFLEPTADSKKEIVAKFNSITQAQRDKFWDKMQNLDLDDYYY